MYKKCILTGLKEFIRNEELQVKLLYNENDVVLKVHHATLSTERMKPSILQYWEYLGTVMDLSKYTIDIFSIENTRDSFIKVNTK